MKARVLCFMLVLLAALSDPAWSATQGTQQIQVRGMTRSFILETPDSPAAGPMPLVLLLHGHLGTAEGALGLTGLPLPLSAWVPIVDREHVLVVALQGMEGRDHHTGWHDCRQDATVTPLTDDVAFADEVVKRLVGTGLADAHRVYVMGMSNGGMMSYRLALEMQPTPAAIVAVSASMALHSDCHALPHPVSVMIINGTGDPILPYGGGKVNVTKQGHHSGEVVGITAVRDFWLHWDGLDGIHGMTGTFPHQAASGKTEAVRTIWGSDAGPQVVLVTVRNGGHAEPSLKFPYGALYVERAGIQNRDFESAEEAWKFFQDKRTK